MTDKGPDGLRPVYGLNRDVLAHGDVPAHGDVLPTGHPLNHPEHTGQRRSPGTGSIVRLFRMPDEMDDGNGQATPDQQHGNHHH